MAGCWSQSKHKQLDGSQLGARKVPARTDQTTLQVPLSITLQLGKGAGDAGEMTYHVQKWWQMAGKYLTKAHQLLSNLQRRSR